MEDRAMYQREDGTFGYTIAQQQKLENWFVYHAPTPEQIPLYGRLRTAARDFAQVIIECTPECADQTMALRKVRESVMMANVSIACGGK